MLRKRVALTLAAGLLGSLGLITPAEANHAWGKYHWSRTAPEVGLAVGDNVSPAWDAYLAEAIADWNSTSALAVSGDAGQTTPATCAPIAGRVEACSDDYGNNSWLGLASIWAARGGHITQATTKVNDYYFKQQTYDKPDWRDMVMCQEIGHDFGLAHQDESFTNDNLGSCMDYTNDPSGLLGTNGELANRGLNLHDHAQLSDIYAHLDGARPGGKKQASKAVIGNDRSSWGTEVQRSADGRVSVFERDLGAGELVLTHVTWALDADVATSSAHDHAEHGQSH